MFVLVTLLFASSLDQIAFAAMFQATIVSAAISTDQIEAFAISVLQTCPSIICPL